MTRLLASSLLLVVVAGCGGAGAPVAPEVPATTVATAPDAAPVATTANPCFAGDPPLAARDVYQRLERHAWAFMDPDSAPPAEPFGSCTVHRGELRAADGTLVAELDCAVRILVPGIHDELGLEIGARGGDVLARLPADRGPLVCFPNGPDQARCGAAQREDGDLNPHQYVVAGALPGDVLEGEAAEVFFAPRDIVEIFHNAWCH